MYFCPMNIRPDIIIENTLSNLGDERFSGYLCHAYCRKGHCDFAWLPWGKYTVLPARSTEERSS